MDVIDVTEDDVAVFVVIFALVALACNFIPKGSHVGASVVDHQSWMMLLSSHCFSDLQ